MRSGTGGFKKARKQKKLAFLGRGMKYLITADLLFQSIRSTKNQGGMSFLICWGTHWCLSAYREPTRSEGGEGFRKTTCTVGNLGGSFE